MHEMHMIKDLFNDLLKLAEEKNIKKITRVYIKMGEFTEINPEIFKYHFYENSKDTIASDAVIDITKSENRELRLLSFDGE